MSKTVCLILLNKYKIGIITPITETYNIIRAKMICWGTLKERLINRDAKFIHQPKHQIRIKSRVVAVLAKGDRHRGFDASLLQEKCLEHGCLSQVKLIQEITMASQMTSDLEVQQSLKIDLLSLMMPLRQLHLLLPLILKKMGNAKSPRNLKQRQALKPSQPQSVPNLITCLISVVVCQQQRSSTWFITKSKLASVYLSARATWKCRSYQGNPIRAIPLRWSKFTATCETNSSSSSRTTRRWKWKA